MRSSLIHKRLEILATKFRPGAIREFTLEELCRLYWRRDKRGFTRFVERECPTMRAFITMFQREDDDRALRAERRTVQALAPSRSRFKS